MQHILIAYDAKDEGALERRMAARAAHVEMLDNLRASGQVICGIAITDDADKMIGSVVVTNFSSREELDAWLKVEPYVIHNVWNEVTVLNGKIGPSFANLIKKAA
jgi:uncharacterized protein YciI